MTLGKVSEGERSVSSILIAGAVLAGAVFPGVSAHAYPYAFHSLILVVLFSFMMLETGLSELFSRIHPLTRLALGWQALALPALATAICLAAQADANVTAVLVATSTAGSVFASPTLARLMGLNQAVAAQTMVLSTLVMPATLLIFSEIAGIVPPDMSLFIYLQHIVFFLVAPLVLAAIYWETAAARPALAERSHRLLHWASTLALLVFCFGVMSRLHVSDGPEPPLAKYIVIVCGSVVVGYVGTALLFRSLGRRDSLTLGMLAANRNVALAFALLGEALPEDVLVYVALAQFPIFLAPVILRLVNMLARRRARDEAPPASASP